MPINFTYFRRSVTSREWYSSAIFVVTSFPQQFETPYRVLSELVSIVTNEKMSINRSLLVVTDGNKSYLYGDNCLADLASQIGIPRFTHTLII